MVFVSSFKTEDPFNDADLNTPPQVIVERQETLAPDSLGVRATHWVPAPVSHYRQCVTLAVEKLLLTEKLLDS